MKTWDDWSDFDVNKAVAINIGMLVDGAYIDDSAIPASIDGVRYRPKDYCNNWSDMGPLIDKHGINLSSTHCPAGSGLVYSANCNDRIHDAGWQPSYCRAAAIVFLMMHGVKQ